MNFFEIKNKRNLLFVIFLVFVFFITQTTGVLAIEEKLNFDYNGVDKLVPLATDKEISDNSPVITPPASQNTKTTRDPNCGIDSSKNIYNYCMLAPVNGLLGENKTTGMLEVNGLTIFFSKLYRIGIMVAIALAILMITFGGIRLATTDSISGTEKGRDMIKSAITGLLLALFSYVILYTINPELVLQTNSIDSTFKIDTKK